MQIGEVFSEPRHSVTTNVAEVDADGTTTKGIEKGVHAATT